MQKLFYPILYATTISSAFPVIAGLARYKHSRIDTKLLLFLFTLVLIIDCYCIRCSWEHISANWIHHFYAPVEFAIFGFAIASWQTNQLGKKIMLWIIPAFFLLAIWDIFVVRELGRTNDFTASIACALFIGLTSYTLIGFERRMARSSFRDYRSWFLIGLLVYSAGNLAYFLFFRHVISYYLWAGHNALNILANVIYTIGFLCQVTRD